MATDLTLTLTDNDFQASAGTGEFTLRGALQYAKLYLEFDGTSHLYAQVSLLHPEDDRQAKWSIRIPGGTWSRLVKSVVATGQTDLGCGNWVCSKRIHYREDGTPDTFTVVDSEGNEKVRFRYDYDLHPVDL